MFFRQILEPNLSQYAYLIGCQRTGEAIIIDPMRDIERYKDLAAQEDLRIVAATETHIHADYLSGAREFAEQDAVKLYLSDLGGPDWQYFWAKENAYDVTFVQDGDIFKVGNIAFKVVHTPGHTPEHISFLVTDLGGGADEPMGLLSGDFVFVGDLGRPDLLETAAGEKGAQEPAARILFQSVQDFLDLPEYLQIWPGHGAGSACGKALGAVPESTVGYEKRFNASIQAALQGEDQFVSSILDGQPEPPLYFARMKHLNKHGAPVLGPIPTPQHLPIHEMTDKVANDAAVVVDTRRDRKAFMAGHLPGSLYAPLDNTFPTVTGSFIRPEEEILLLVEKESDVAEAVLNLIRIGLDRVTGYALVAELQQLDELQTIPTIMTTALSEAKGTPLDVRRMVEFAEGAAPDAVNIAHTRLLDRLDELDRNASYTVYCRSGARAAVSAALLRKHGFDVTYTDGLFAEWAAKARQTVPSA